MTIDTIRAEHRKAKFAIKTQAKLDRSLEAFIRQGLGWNLGLDEKTRNAINAQAKRIIATVEKGETPKPEDAVACKALAPIIVQTLAARDPFDAIREGSEKVMEKLARDLPAYDWVEKLRGFGAKGFAQIVGEAGDIGTYSNPGKLWKRMGLAPYLGRSGKSWRGVTGKEALKAEEWVALGYSGARRSVMWNVGQAMFKAQSALVDKETGEVKREAGEYRKLYDERKAYELTKTDKPIVAHSRAMRYVEKRLLRELWRAWRAAEGRVTPEPVTPPAAPILEAAE